MKEQCKMYDDKTKTVHIQDRMEPIKIQILTPPLVIKEDDCCSKTLNFLKVSILVVLLLILSWTAVALYSKRCFKELQVNETLEQFVNIQEDYKPNKNTLLKLNDITTESTESVKSLDSDYHEGYKILHNSPDSVILVNDADEDSLEVYSQLIVKREAVTDPTLETSGPKQSAEQEKHVDHILPGVTLPTLMAKHLESVVGPNFELLDWYYRCKANPELEKGKDKLHVSTAKWLFGIDIATFKKDSDTVSSLLMDPAYVLELREIIDKNMTLTPQTPVQRRIVDIIMMKAKLDSEMENKPIPSWYKIGLEGLNAETLKNFYLKKKEIADGCKNCSKDEKEHLESLKNLVDRYTDSEESSEEKSSAGVKSQDTNEALESLKKLKKVAVEKASERTEKKSS